MLNLDPTESNSGRRASVSHFYESFWWLISRAAFLCVLIVVTVLLDIPLRAIFEGDVLKQMAGQKSKALRAEVEMLRDMQRSVDEMGVALAVLRVGGTHSSRTATERGDAARALLGFSNAMNRFDERFAARSNLLGDRELELAFYNIRDTSRRIADELNSDSDAIVSRKFAAQADLFDKLTGRVRFMATEYVCKRSGKRISVQGECY